MGKSIQEKLVETYSVKATGTVDIQDLTIETEDEGVVFIQDLLSKAHGKHGVLSFQAKAEKDLSEEDVEDDCFV